MKRYLSVFEGLGYVFAGVLACVAIALLRSEGSVNLNLWFASFILGGLFIVLWFFHKIWNKQNPISIRIALIFELILLLVTSLIMGGDTKSFGYSDPASVTFLGKTYLAENHSHDHIEKLVNIVFGTWAFSFVAILLTILLSLFLRSESTRSTILQSDNAIDINDLKNDDRIKIKNFFHIIVTFVSVFIISSNIPKTQDPYRSLIDKSFIIVFLWLCFLVSCILFAASKKPLRYPALMYFFQAIGMIAALAASNETKDLYGVTYSSQVTALKIIGLVSIVLIIIMFFRSALFKYKKIA